MFCSKCGSANDEAVSFCTNCGKQIKDVAEEPKVSSGEMTYTQLLFSCKGRIPRSTYWLKFLLPFLVLNFTFKILDLALGTVIVPNAHVNVSGGYIGILSLIFSLALIYPGIAVVIKRLHDRGRSGWFFLLFLVPFLNLWPIIEVCFLKGTTGANKYGDDPLG